MAFIDQSKFETKEANMADVLVWAEETEQSYDAICELKKIPARLGLTDHDLVEQSADLVSFEKEIAPSPYGAVSRATDLDAARRRGNSRVRKLLQRFHDARSNLPAAYGREDWNTLIAFVADREGFVDRGALFATGKSRSLTTLRARVRVAPKDLTQPELDRVMSEATSQKRKSLRKAIKFLNLLIKEFSDAPEVADLLPSTPFDAPSGSDRARSITWKNLPDALRFSCEQAMEAAVMGPAELVARARARMENGEDPVAIMAELNNAASTKRKPPGNPKAAKEGYKCSIKWLVRAAEDIGQDISQIAAIEDLFTLEIIEAACRQQIARSQASEELKDPNQSQTLGSRLKVLRALAGNGMNRADLVAHIDLQKRLNADFVVTPGSIESDEIDTMCRLIQCSPHLAANFVNAPKAIADRAEEKIRAAREAGNTEAEARGLRLFATAIAFALQVSRPVRTSNIIRLRHRSCGDLPGNLVWMKKGKHARLTFKEKEVKNRQLIIVHLEDDEARLLWKWLTDYRARYLALRGLEDSAYILPGAAKPRLEKRELTLPKGCVAPSTMSEIWGDGARIIGVDLTPHQSRHAIATLVLALEPGNFAKVASVLGDEEETVRKYYGRDSGEAAAREVRAALKKKHPGAFRKLKGGH